MKLTVRQQEVLATIREFISRNGVSPTVRELGMLLGGISPCGVSSHLFALTREGYITRKERTARGIEVV